MDMYKILRGVLMAAAVVAVCSTAAAGQAPVVNDAPLVSGDRVVVKIWLDTTFADTVRMDQTGSLTLPRVGPLGMANIPASQVADSVRSAYARVTRTLAIEVTPLRRVTVGGEVRDPGVYFVETHVTVREAVSIAGGVTDIGSTGKVRLTRNGVTKHVKNWDDRSDDDVIVRSSDVIWLNREPWIKRNVFGIVSGVGVLLSVVLSLTR